MDANDKRREELWAQKAQEEKEAKIERDKYRCDFSVTFP